MTVTAVLRYPNKFSNRISITREVPEGTTAGAFSRAVLTDYEKQEAIHFSGANIAVLIDGRIAGEDRLLRDGDEVTIIPVAAGG